MSGRRNGDSPGRIGPLIKRYREMRAMTQRELAAAAGLSVGGLRDLEQGRTSCPQWRTLECLIAALDIGSHLRADLLLAWRAGPDAAGPVADGRREIGTTLRIDVLGPLAARHDGTPLALGSVRQRAVLGLLALNYGIGVPVDAMIIDALWGNEPPVSVVAVVQGYICRLRKQLRSTGHDAASGELVVTVPTGYRLDAAADQLDLTVFRQLIWRAEAKAAGGDVAAACDLYEQAVDLWRGPALADIGLLRCHPAVTALGYQRAAAIVRFAEVAALASAHARALPHLRGLCAADEFNEQAHAHLMISLAACGQQAAALSVFGELRRRLDRELGMPPGPQLAQAHLRVLQQQVGTSPAS